MFSVRRLILLVVLFFSLIYCYFHFALPPASMFYQATPAPTQDIKGQITSTRQTNALRSPKDLITPTAFASKYPSLPTYHIVQIGESLSTIAPKYNLTVEDLVLVNYITNANYIEAGQVLLINTKPIKEPKPIESGKQIIVILSEQSVYAYEDGRLIKEFLISSGTVSYPTIAGNYSIERKYPTDDMSGPGYYIEDVPWVMYFHKGYSFHGTTWHDNFGTPMSHGCLNMTVDDASWLYEWSPVGTIVQVIP